MIGWGDVYKVVAAMAPLYFALALGYGSVRWWKLFTPDQCGAINRLTIYFAFPFFGFDIAAHAGSFATSYRVLASDAVAKAGAALALVGCAAACRAPYSWCITGFSIVAFNNSLLIGVPVMEPMYGAWAHDVAVQMAMMQVIFWFPLMIVFFEVRQAWLEMPSGAGLPSADHLPVIAGEPSEDDRKMTGWSFCAMLLRIVGRKLARNPNAYSSLLGLAWSLIANRWHLELPDVVDGSISVMSKTGVGLGMFSMGLFIARQDKFITCGARLTALSLALRFIAGPAAAAARAVALGLRGELLRFAIVQAYLPFLLTRGALPHSIRTFNFAVEYDLHADVLSTGIIFGTLGSLPVLIAYYTVLGLIR